MPVIFVLSVYAIGSYFIALPIQHYRNRAVSNTRIHRAAEQCLDLLGFGRRGDIPVIRLSAQNAVADASPHRISLVARFRNSVYNIFYFFRQIYYHITLHLS